MGDAGSRLAEFKPDPSPPPTNGSHLKRTRVLAGGAITFGVLVGALVAVSAVGRVQWLNLATVGWWGRPVLAAGLAGLMAGWYARRGAFSSAINGMVAALVSLWGVYAIVRLSTNVIFIERSLARVVTFDLLRLAAYGLPAGALGGLVPASIRTHIARMGHRRERGPR
ncbi:MAG TPA: hypothetical protein VGB52_02485 [Actinomycetota bacterium]